MKNLPVLYGVRRHLGRDMVPRHSGNTKSSGPGGLGMSAAHLLDTPFRDVQVNAAYSDAVVALTDGSRLCFRHTVDERWARAVGPDVGEQADTIAARLLGAIARFRLNAKHLDVFFNDGSRWEHVLRPAGGIP